MENVYLQMYWFCILYFNCFRDSRIESQQVIMCARTRALKVYWKAFTPRTWPYWDLTYTLCFWRSRIEVLSRASWHSSVNWPAEGCTKVCRNGDPGGFLVLNFENLFLLTTREFVAELIGTIIFVFIAKATGFALAPGTQQVWKTFGVWSDFENYLQAAHLQGALGAGLGLMVRILSFQFFFPWDL